MKKIIFLILILILTVGAYSQAAGYPPRSSISAFSVHKALLWLIVGALFTAIGLITMASGHIIMTLREIALNTREENSKNTNDYNSFQNFSGVCKVTGLIVIFGGWIVSTLVFLGRF